MPVSATLSTPLVRRALAALLAESSWKVFGRTQPVSSLALAHRVGAELKRLMLSSAPPLCGLNASEFLVEREGIYQDP